MSSDEKATANETEHNGEIVPAGHAPHDEAESASAERADVDSAPPQRTARGGLFGWLVLLALIVALGGGAYYWQQNVYRADLATLEEQISALDGAQAVVRADVDATASLVASAVSEVAADVDALKSKIDGTASAQENLRRSVSALYEKETQTSVDWILAEAEYLVLAATQRLALERDVVTAIAALRAADQRLRSAEHPDLIPVRDQIIADLTALEAVNLPDIEGLAIYIAKTIGQVDALPTKPIAEEVTPFATVRDGEYKTEDWRRLASAVWSDLVELVEVKDAALPDGVLFDPELRYFLRQNLKLELASARLAVLRRDSANLEASRELIQRLFDAYYDVDDAAVAAISKRLDDAAALELDPALPNISGSLDVIRKYRKSHATDQGPAQ